MSLLKNFKKINSYINSLSLSEIVRVRSVAMTLSAFITASCGFTPIYKTVDENGNAAMNLAAVKVESSHDLMGQFYSNRLTDLLNPAAVQVEPQYRMTTTLSKSKTPLAIQQDRTITRYKIVVSVNYRLVDINSGKVIDEGNLRREGGYDKVDSDYATYISDEDTTRRIIKELAEDTRIRIMAILVE